MKNNNRLIVITTLIIAAMLVFFSATMVFLDNNRGNLKGASVAVEVESKQESDERELPVQEELEGQIDFEVSQRSNSTVSEAQITERLDALSFSILTEAQIDSVVEDSAIREVEEEAYVKSMELLPSVKNQRRLVSKDMVEQGEFAHSFVASEILEKVKGADAEGRESEISFIIPKEICIYNADNQASSSVDIECQFFSGAENVAKCAWSSKDTKLVSVSNLSGYTTTVSKNSDYIGDCEVGMFITYSTGKNSTATKEYNIIVHVLKVEGEESFLFAKEGDALYIDVEGTRQATFDDYNKYDHFYGDVRTTGWQLEDNNSYYYNSLGVPVTGKQIIQGTLYAFDDNGVLISSRAGEKGIDVSKYQKEIDWQQVAESGISFAIIRCGYRGAVGAQLVEDPYFKRNIAGAKAAGIKVGVYFFTQAITVDEAYEEAKMAMDLCKGYTLDLPIYIDSENATRGRANGLDKYTRTQVLEGFCQAVAAKGYRAGVYASKSWFINKVEVSRLEGYNIWCAQYNTECTYSGKKDIWQYSSKATIPGIVGYVDVDVMY